jgi:hypothetical protein
LTNINAIYFYFFELAEVVAKNWMKHYTESSTSNLTNIN